MKIGLMIAAFAVVATFAACGKKDAPADKAAAAVDTAKAAAADAAASATDAVKDLTK